MKFFGTKFKLLTVNYQLKLFENVEFTTLLEIAFNYLSSSIPNREIKSSLWWINVGVLYMWKMAYTN